MSHNYFYYTNDNLYILVKITPAAKKTEIIKEIDIKTPFPVKSALKINISAPALENKANKELIKFLSKALNIRKNQLIIEKGNKSNIKLLKLPKNIEINSLL